jgi:hypothetical protein
MAPKLRETLAVNATAAAGVKHDTVSVATKDNEKLRKRLTRIKSKKGPSTTLEQLEWFADLVGVEPWELLVPDFDPTHRPQLLADDTEISGLTPDETRLIRNLRETDRLGPALGVLGLKPLDEGASQTLGGGRLSDGRARTRGTG